MDLGPHAPFILASYVIFFSVLFVVIVWLFWSELRLKNKLAEREAQGATRRMKKMAS